MSKQGFFLKNAPVVTPFVTMFVSETWAEQRIKFVKFENEIFAFCKLNALWLPSMKFTEKE
jgi:hypothetical protein